MDFEVLPRRKLTKKSIGPFSLVSLIAGLFILLSQLRFQFIVALLMDLVLVLVASGFLVYGWRLRRQQRRLQQALQDLDLVQLTKDDKVGLFLYLRSFRMGRSTLLRRVVPYAYGDQSLLDGSLGLEAFHFEENISNAIDPHGLLIAIGDRNDSYGAGKVIASDERWKDHFHRLATHSWMIFVQPDLTQSVRWEVGQLLGNVSYLRKTVWVMPRRGGGKWTEIRDGLRQDIAVLLPSHHAGGGMFRLHPDSGDVPVAPNIFASTLTSVLEDAKGNGRPFDIEQLWERALADDRACRANDQALRDLLR